MRSTYGAPAGSSLEDWPITYDDLEPFYEKAEYEIGVSGDYSGTPFHGPRRRDLPMPPLAAQSRIRDSRARRQAPGPASVPSAHAAQQRALQRPRTLHALPLVLRICLRSRRQERLAEHGDSHRARHRQLRTAHRVHGQRNPHRRSRPRARRGLLRRARAAAAATLPTSSSSPPAAIESARLLLNSSSRLFPNGLGNRYDQVGRNLQGHHYTGAIGYFDFDTYDDVGPGASIAIMRLQPRHARPVRRRHAGQRIHPSADPHGRSPARRHAALGTRPQAGHAHWHKRSIVIMGPTQQIPTGNRPRHRSIRPCATNGECRLPAFEGNVHPHTFEIGDSAGQARRSVAQRSRRHQHLAHGLASESVSAGQHQAGTCRMGNDPHSSVVNRDCQLHDVDNVFVIDGSVHVTNGGFNPVLTIMAIAYYASACAGSQLERHGVPVMMRVFKLLASSRQCSAVLGVAVVYGASSYYTSQRGQGCASCHEMAQYVSAVHASPHRTATAWIATKRASPPSCAISAYISPATPPEAIRLRDVDVFAMTTQLPECHQHEYASWHAGPHSATYSADLHQSRAQHRTPPDGRLLFAATACTSTGPSAISCSRRTRRSVAHHPRRICRRAHHALHGLPPDAPRRRGASPSRLTRISVAARPFDRFARILRSSRTDAFRRSVCSRSRNSSDGAAPGKDQSRSAPGTLLPVPRTAPARSRSHAATNHWGPQVGSGDDRTPMGVHEGISCLACHNGHNESATRLLQDMPSADVPLRHRRRKDGHHFRQRQKPPQHPLGPLHRLSPARHSQTENISRKTSFRVSRVFTGELLEAQKRRSFFFSLLSLGH